ncbi:MAG: hypothetical protein HOP15_10455 [Planctomycetes bacterium]|nr:hypothetical protein [Planctomycetota bacterium]
MTDTDWGDEGGQARPKKKRIPTWAWWTCGGGCLLVTLVSASVAVFAVRLYREGRDPERQWPRLGEVLAFEERPAGIELKFGASVGASQFHLFDREKNLRATLVEYPSTAAADYKRIMDPDFSLPMGFGAPVDPERGTLVIQGREVPSLRFTRIKPEPEGQGFGPGVRLDLTGKRAKPRTLELRRPGPGRIEDAEVEAFLLPFEVWKE